MFDYNTHKLHQHFRALNHVVATAVQTMSKEDAERSKADWFQLARIANFIPDEPLSKSRYELYGEVMRTRAVEIIIQEKNNIPDKISGFGLCSCLRYGKITDDEIPYNRAIAPYGLNGLLANRDCDLCQGAGRLISLTSSSPTSL